MASSITIAALGLSPAGVVAVRVGTASAGFSQFVRVSDARDPNLSVRYPPPHPSLVV